MAFIKRVILLFFPMLLFTQMVYGKTPGKSAHCPDANARIIYHQSSDFTHACSGVAAAADFMAGHGFNVANHIEIEIVDLLSRRHLSAAFGHYYRPARKIEILSYKSFVKDANSHKPFGLAPDQHLYRSFVAHEAAHAIVHANRKRIAATTITQEYVAYVVQLASLPDSHIKEILDNFPYGSFKNEREINIVYLGLNPHNFAIKCYLHYLSDQEGSNLLSRLRYDNIVDMCANDRYC